MTSAVLILTGFRSSGFQQLTETNTSSKSWRVALSVGLHVSCTYACIVTVSARIINPQCICTTHLNASTNELMASERVFSAVCVIFVALEGTDGVSYLFYAPQLVPAGAAEARIGYGNSVCLSVRLGCHDPVLTVLYQAQVR